MRGPIWIISVTECYTKLVETVVLKRASRAAVVALKRANGAAIVNFVRDNIICSFDSAKRILSDNSTSFLNYYV